MALIDDVRSALGSAYSIERELGGGGMSRLFVGEETALGRKVAVKVLAPELAAGVSAERFNREIKLAAQLQHPNIVPVLTTGIAAGLPYYTMPFVDGLSLRARLERNPGVPIVEAVAILKDVARALAYAHDHGIVHRDIKPDNVLLADEAAVVTDFGIAKALSAARTPAPGGTLTQTGTSIGTPAYMAPEQISADPSIDHRADIYSFGCVAYELLTGSAPFAHRQPQQLYAAHLTERPSPLLDRRPDCPPDLTALVMKCLEKEPASRPQSAREILRALETTTTTAKGDAKRESRDTSRSGRQLVIAAVAGIAIVSALGAYFTRDRGSSSIHSLAVLPFENIGGDTANAYFAEGMSDEITTELARVPGLTLASRNSVAKYRGADPRDVGKALEVHGVIDGTVRRAGDRLRLTAQLTDASTGKLIWSDTYEQKVQDVFAVQDSITTAIVAALRIKLGEPEHLASAKAINAQGTSNLEAYDLYLRGRFLLQRRGHYLYQALDRFEEATKKDPNFARAYAGYAMAASVLPQYTDAPSDSITPIGLKFGRRAVELDPTLADAYLGLGNMVQYNFKWDEAIGYFKRAIEIEPNNATAHQWLGDVYWLTGRGKEALAELQKAGQLEPASAVIRQDLTSVLFNLGYKKESQIELTRSFELDSAFPFNKINKAILHYDKKQFDSVTAIKGDPYPPYVSIFRMLAYNKLGDRANADRLRDSLFTELRKPNADNDGSRRATLFAALRNKDSTFYYIDRAIERRGAMVFTTGLPCFPMLSFLHSDPRWKQILKRINAVECEGLVVLD
ncbi:MAG TPA: protein kinase [Gemmatimonadaceae bacterium]|jgi:serine/threonine-protein kinase|nr:protein kinase [Gemmatimonadaceae bacterium]